MKAGDIFQEGGKFIETGPQNFTTEGRAKQHLRIADRAPTRQELPPELSFVLELAVKKKPLEKRRREIFRQLRKVVALSPPQTLENFF